MAVNGKIEVRVVNRSDRIDAEKYRLWQARQILQSLAQTSGEPVEYVDAAGNVRSMSENQTGERI